ncbi:MAG: MerR family transcriptional regulator [Bacteroidetes bacterium]|nr:MAG: MerR family transcriptional regulator [Bacteroidota bacterium]TAG85477.1 MAG: MerR family transcriptional regulator [Bacteroidota bacterium]
MSLYSIRDLEHLSGIKAHTLRIWEQRYNIVTPKRTDSNIRYYDDEDLKLILNISLLKDNDHKISHIAEMSPEDMKNEVFRITDKSTKADEQVQALTLAMIDLDEERFEKLIGTNALQMGFERTMLQVIYPFLIRIGFLWQTGAINPAQEHFITNLVRQKLIVAIDGQVIHPEKNASKYLLYLPEGEMHELSLLFANYIIKTRNHKVIYLGQSLPFVDLERVCKLHQPEYIMTIVTAAPIEEGMQNYINRLSNTFPTSTILMSGYKVVGQDWKTPENVTLINKIEDLIDLVERNV